MDEDSRLDTILNQYKVPLLLTLVGVVLLIGGVFSSGLISKTFIKSTTASKSPDQTIQKDLKIDISGSVKHPGVYNLTTDSRIEDGIKAAGGLSEEADLGYIQKNINLAQRLTDGTKIFIPKKGEINQAVLGTSSQAVVQTSNSVNSQSIINVNSASSGELDSLPGIGMVGAQKIIDNRPYSSLEELVTKKAIGKAVFEKIKNLISIY